MSGEIKRIDIAEFRALGFIQEINRLVLHPCGLAIEVAIEADGTETLGGVWDYRDDAEGITYGGDLSLLVGKAESVRVETDRHAAARRALFGAVVQPLTSGDAL